MAFVDLVVPMSKVAWAWTPVPAAQFQLDLWHHYVRTAIRNRVTRKPYDRVLDQLDYWADDGSWKATNKHMRFRCNDDGGAVGAALGAHLLELGVAWVVAVPDWGMNLREKGFDVQPTRDALTQVTHSLVRFVELRSEVHQLETSASGVVLHADFKPLTWDALKPAEQAKVQAVADSGLCACQLCAYHRPRLPRESVANAKKSKDMAAGRAKAHAARDAEAAATPVASTKPQNGSQPVARALARPRR